MKAKQINELKLRLEARASRQIYQVLNNQAGDVVNAFNVNQLNAENIAENYIPEMLNAVRNAMRMSIATFGNSLRNDIAKEFNIAFKSTIDNSNFDNINKQLSFDFAVFIANQSENQVKYITETSANEITNIVNRQTTIKQEEVGRLIRERNELANVDTAEARKRIATIDIVVRNAKRDVAKNIKINLLQNNISRSRLIGEQVIGIAEAYAREREAEVISNSNIQTSRGVIKNTKIWNAILDKKTRDYHAMADGQEVEINNNFNVGGEQLKYPRDPNGSPANTIRCRCVAIYSTNYI